jgi:hypothetical protein
LTVAVSGVVLRVTDWRAGDAVAVHQTPGGVTLAAAGTTQAFADIARVWVDVQADARVTNDTAGLGTTAARLVQVARRDVTGSRFVSTITLAAGATSGPAVSPPPGSPPTPADWFDTAVQDTTLRTLARSEAQDGTLDRGDVLRLFAQVGADGTVSTAEFHDLGDLLHPARVTFGTGPGYAMPAPVQALAADVIDGDASNRVFQGTALGNLHAGSGADQLNKLVAKWFLGQDRPQVRAGETYRLVSGALFQNGPGFRDVRQGNLGDCYFVAALAEVALDRPQAIKDMFTDNGDGTFTVRFFRDGTQQYVTVDRFLPTDAAGRVVYAAVGGRYDSAGNELWVALAEKAYAQINEDGWLGHAATNSYAAIDGGYSDLVFKHVMGVAAGWTWGTASSAAQLAAAAAAGRPTVLSSRQSGSGNGVVDGHGYALVGYNPAAQTFTLYNPWGSTIDLTWAQIQASFYGFWQSA